MFENIKRLYKSGQLTPGGVQRAVMKGWITAAQAQEILEEDSDVL